MNPFNRTRELLLQILEAIGRIEPYIARGEDAFYGDELIYTFVAHWLAGVGESVKGLPPEFRARHIEIDWRRATGMRDVISHNYFGLKLDVVWDTATKYLPTLRAAVERILATDAAVHE